MSRIEKMNQNLKKLTIEKLKFRHSCVKEKSNEIIENDLKPSLTAFEKFKLTP